LADFYNTARISVLTFALAIQTFVSGNRQIAEDDELIVILYSGTSYTIIRLFPKQVIT
jgi:hypothetical protein